MPEPDDSPPWQRPGAVRRDCEPHRGPGLCLLDSAALVCGAVSLCAVVPLTLAVPLAGVAIVLARADLALMRQGRMDPDGQEATENALEIAAGALLLSALALALGLGLLVTCWVR